MAGKKKNKTVIVGVRFPPDLYKWVQAQAEEEGLSACALIRICLMKKRKAA